ncbi:MAG: hypothetical protein KKA19_01875 [Candidatus Margulisbacteria bacterium]|nr:hypothetical protein [Candidatus Margulisiibacteriota bacterium]
MSYKKIISANNRGFIADKENLRNIFIKIFSGAEVPPFRGIIKTSEKGTISFRIKYKTYNLYTGEKKQQIIHFELLHTNAYGYILRLKDDQGNILNDYQLIPKVKCFEKSYEFQTITDYISGSAVQPLACSAQTNHSGYVFFVVNNKLYIFSANQKKSQIVYLEPISTESYGIVLRLKDKNGKFLNDYQLRPTLKLFDRGYEFQIIIDHISGLNVKPLPCSINTINNGTIHFYIKHKHYVFSTGSKKQKMIHLEPIHTEAYGIVLRLKDINGNILNDYQLKPALRRFERGYEFQTIHDYIFNSDIEPVACAIKTDINGVIGFKKDDVSYRFNSGQRKEQVINITPIKTEAYGFVFRLINTQENFLCDYQVRPKYKFLKRGYEFQTINDFLSGKNIQPLPCKIETASRGIICFYIGNKGLNICTPQMKKKTVWLIPKYSGNYGWLIEIWNENKTELLSTIDRRRL